MRGGLGNPYGTFCFESLEFDWGFLLSLIQHIWTLYTVAIPHHHRYMGAIYA